MWQSTCSYVSTATPHPTPLTAHPSPPPSLCTTAIPHFSHHTLTPSPPPLTVLTPLAHNLLEHIPIAVALGVFLYLTYASLSGVQMVRRAKLLITPPKHHPDTYYVRKVGTRHCAWPHGGHGNSYKCDSLPPELALLCPSSLDCPPLQVRTLKMHLFTVIQLLLLAALWGLKLSPAGMVYPVAIVGLIPIRWLLGKFVFTHAELEAVSGTFVCHLNNYC